jgi:hypothetical protein
MQSILDVGQQLTTTAVTPAPLNPNFNYLRVHVKNRVAYFVLGYIDKHPSGDVEVWYSAEREVLRLQNGRLVGATGSATEWSGVELIGQPSWSNSQTTQTFERVRDVSPGYQHGIHEKLQVRQIAPPKKTFLSRDVNKEALNWYEEQVITDTQKNSISLTSPTLLPVTIYAVHNNGRTHQVIYSETCLASDLCFSWQHWKP